MKRETKLMRQIQVAASRLGYRLFRNHNGVAWVGTVLKTREPNTIVIKNARRIRLGLGVGTSDLIGWKPVIITQDMVGQVLAQFVAREVKTPKGHATTPQIDFILTVNNAGGDGLIISAVDALS